MVGSIVRKNKTPSSGLTAQTRPFPLCLTFGFLEFQQHDPVSFTAKLPILLTLVVIIKTTAVSGSGNELYKGSLKNFLHPRDYRHYSGPKGLDPVIPHVTHPKCTVYRVLPNSLSFGVKNHVLRQSQPCVIIGKNKAKKKKIKESREELYYLDKFHCHGSVPADVLRQFNRLRSWTDNHL